MSLTEPSSAVAPPPSPFHKTSEITSPSPSPTEKAMEDFCFPAVAAEQGKLRHLSFPHFASSPIRFLSSSATLDRRRRVLEEGSRGLMEADKEERMDMLWEDFNEELGPCRARKFDGGVRRQPAAGFSAIRKALKRLCSVLKNGSVRRVSPVCHK